jgi:hypothetical protein
MDPQELEQSSLAPEDQAEEQEDITAIPDHAKALVQVDAAWVLRQLKEHHGLDAKPQEASAFWGQVNLTALYATERAKLKVEPWDGKPTFAEHWGTVDVPFLIGDGAGPIALFQPSQSGKPLLSVPAKAAAMGRHYADIIAAGRAAREAVRQVRAKIEEVRQRG